MQGPWISFLCTYNLEICLSTISDKKVKIFKKNNVHKNLYLFMKVISKESIMF